VTAWRNETTVYQEVTEENPEDIVRCGAWKVPKDEAAVKPVGALKKLHRGRYLDVGRRGKPKEWA
jgi:hypothetical protein